MFACQGVEFQAQLGPSDLFPPVHAADVLPQDVPRDADQPRPHRGRPAQLLAPQVAPQKDLLAQVLGIGWLDEPGPKKAIDRVLVQFDQGCKCPVVPPLGRRNQCRMPLRLRRGDRPEINRGRRYDTSHRRSESAGKRIHAGATARRHARWEAFGGQTFILARRRDGGQTWMDAAGSIVTRSRDPFWPQLPHVSPGESPRATIPV